jgi:hypothetical protein
MAVVSVCSSAEFETLASLSQFKSVLSVTSTDNDDLMTDVLKNATGAIESYLGRTLRRQTYYEKVASYGSMFLQVSNTPVQSISRILKDDFLVSSTEYEIARAESGSIYRQYGWSWTAGTVTDLVPHALPGTERLSFAVEYKGGYVESTSTSTDLGMPPSIVQATIEVGKAWYSGRGRNPLVKMKKVGDYSIEYNDQMGKAELPKSALALLQDFQRVV